MAENTKQFFQITEAARACGLSRSTLMRMEERGLLTPVFTAPDSGRRYYDNHDVARIMQIEKFKAMGLGSKEIADYFAQGGGGRGDAGGVPGAVGAVLRRLQRRGRGVADAGAGGKGAGAEARRRAAGAGHRGAVHGAGDRDAAVLLAAGAAGGGIMGSGRPAVQVSRFCYTNL